MNIGINVRLQRLRLVLQRLGKWVKAQGLAYIDASAVGVDAAKPVRGDERGQPRASTFAEALDDRHTVEAATDGNGGAEVDRGNGVMVALRAA